MTNLADFTFVAHHTTSPAAYVLSASERDAGRLRSSSSMLFRFIAEGHCQQIEEIPSDLTVEFSTGEFDFYRCGDLV
jgi:hypothetical protein